MTLLCTRMIRTVFIRMFQGKRHAERSKSDRKSGEQSWKMDSWHDHHHYSNRQLRQPHAGKFSVGPPDLHRPARGQSRPAPALCHFLQPAGLRPLEEEDLSLSKV